jgi:broad specificity phosphatase PhoE
VAEILLLRHGQASFGSDDYDALSDLGHVQAAVNADYLCRSGLVVDAVYSGSLRRQQETAQALLERYRQAGKPLPEIITDPGFNELENEQQIATLAPSLQQSNSQLRSLLASEPLSKKDFQKILKIVFNHWVLDRPEVEGLESWQVFSSRVRQSLRRVVQQQGSGKTVVVSTSGGVIATIVAQVLNMPDSGVYSLFEPVLNASITRLLYNSAGDVSLSCFNDCGYLRSAEIETVRTDLITYR